MITLRHCEFVDNTSTGSLIDLFGDMITVRLNEFVNNRVDDGAIYIPYYILAVNLTEYFY